MIYWYAIHSHPHKEDALYQQLIANGIEAYYPRIPAHPVNPRARKIVPYFPGYMFVDIDLESVPPVVFQRMMHAVSLVTFGGEPAVVPENLIHAIRRHVDEIIAQGGEINLKLKKGDKVTIQSGPFADYQAIFDMRLPGTARVRVLLKMLNERILPVEIDEILIDRKP